MFDRSRNKSKTFIQEFELYAHVNEDNHAFVQPFKRIFLALSYMKGSKVNDWVRLMRDVMIPHVDCSYVLLFYYMFHHPFPTSPAVPVHDPSGGHVI